MTKVADTRRLNSNRTHRPDCSCPWCRAGEFPRRLEFRMSEDVYDALGRVAETFGESRAEVVRRALGRYLEAC